MNDKQRLDLDNNTDLLETLEQPTWLRVNAGVKVDDIITPPRFPSKTDTLADSVVSIGYVIKDNSFLPSEMRHLFPIGEYNHSCTGTVVKSKRILTAAHCKEMWEQFDQISKMTKSKIDFSKHISFLVIPTRKPDKQSYLNNKAVPFSINDFRSNPNYSKTGDRQNDVAVIVLKKPIQAIVTRIIDPGQIIPNTTTLRVYGYSWMETGEDLKYTEAKIPSNYEKTFTEREDQEAMKNLFFKGQSGAATEYFSNEKNPNKKVLFHPVSKDRHSCPGTSGGPIFAQIKGHFYVAGVTSGGDFLDESCDNKKLQIDPSEIGNKDISSREASFSFEQAPALATHGSWLHSMLSFD